MAVLRDLIHASNDISALAYNPPDDLNVVVEEAEKTLFKATEKRISSSFRKADELLTETFEEITKLADQQSHMAGVPSGFRDVDALCKVLLCDLLMLHQVQNPLPGDAGKIGFVHTDPTLL
jgi:replicative DNA helicase